MAFKEEPNKDELTKQSDDFIEEASTHTKENTTAQIFEKYLSEKADKEMKVFSTRMHVSYINIIQELADSKNIPQRQIVEDALDIFMKKFQELKKEHG